MFPLCSDQEGHLCQSPSKPITDEKKGKMLTGRTYDIGKKSDMRRLARDLERSIKTEAKRSIQRSGIEMSCPNCGRKMTGRQGNSRCPHCGNVTNVTFDWSGF